MMAAIITTATGMAGVGVSITIIVGTAIAIATGIGIGITIGLTIGESRLYGVLVPLTHPVR